MKHNKYECTVRKKNPQARMFYFILHFHLGVIQNGLIEKHGRQLNIYIVNLISNTKSILFLQLNNLTIIFIKIVIVTNENPKIIFSIFFILFFI